MEILKCEDIRKVYGSGSHQVIALDGIDLSVEKGEFVAIIGASGSGKCNGSIQSDCRCNFNIGYISRTYPYYGIRTGEKKRNKTIVGR